MRPTRRSGLRALAPAAEAWSLNGAIILGIVFAVLYVGQAVFVPLALALLLSVALMPPASWLERRGVPRVPAALIMMFLASAAIVGVLLLVVSQAITLAAELPGYEFTLRQRLLTLSDGSGVLDRAAETLSRLAEQASSSPQRQTEQVPIVVTDRSQTRGTLARLIELLSWVATPIASLALALLLVTFLLVQREDVRDRVLRLAGTHDLHRTTRAMADATERVGRYLLMQTALNALFGTAMGIGLWAIGIPNAALWGVLGFILRYVPFIGVWIFLCFPVLVTLATTTGWMPLILVLTLFVVVDIVITYALEPTLYGSSTGITPLALLLSSAVWTVLWGPIGLILAPAITACLLIIGRHVPSFSFLNVLLGEGEVLPAPMRFYQRLLAKDIEGAMAIANEQAEQTSQSTVLQELFVSALEAAAQDRRASALRPVEAAGVSVQLAEAARRFVEEPEDARRGPAVLGVAGALDRAAAAIVCAAFRAQGQAPLELSDMDGELHGRAVVLVTAGASQSRISRAAGWARRRGEPANFVQFGEAPQSPPEGLTIIPAALRELVPAIPLGRDPAAVRDAEPRGLAAS
ncbi:AI-2E family transporter [Elioraea rosea]|uniref:AI-2E family transporter n=1 Tax=Elioraea rosea TaxID=2492390 RepID=UPI0013156BED|nr:AI-2E family transporter [Elioraea rosea]